MMVGKSSVYGWKIPTCSISDLNLVEFQISDCLGLPFLEFIKTNKIDYSDAKEWTRDANFLEGDKVIIHGCYWISTEDSTGEEPSISDKWKKGEMFSEDCLNRLWCDGSLFTYMDIMIQIQVAPELSMPLGSNGWSKNKGDKVESLSPKEIAIRLQMLKEKAGIALNMLDQWIRRECVLPGYNGCFDLYKPLNRSCCSGCGCMKNDCGCDSCVDDIIGWNDFAVA